MKKVLLPLLVLGVFLVWPKIALANEGTVRLAPVEGQSGSCYAASVFVDSSYRVLMTCRDLKIAADPENNKYVVWAESATTGRRRRLGEIINGKLQSSIDDKFERLFITLERDSYVTKPAGAEMASGLVEAIDFGAGTPLSGAPKAAVTAAPTQAATQPSVTTTTEQPSRLVSVVAGIGKAILFGFVLLLIIVGVMSYLARRKSL